MTWMKTKSKLVEDHILQFIKHKEKGTTYSYLYIIQLLQTVGYVRYVVSTTKEISIGVLKVWSCMSIHIAYFPIIYCLENTKALLLRSSKSSRYLVKEVLIKDCMTELIKTKKKTKEQKRRLKKFLMTTYFIAWKKWAIRENFRDIVTFLKHFSDADIAEHLRGSGTRPTYVSTASTYEFAKCLSEHLEEGFLSHIVAATNLCLMADKTTDIADRAQLSIFICYTDADDDKVKKNSLGL